MKLIFPSFPLVFLCSSIICATLDTRGGTGEGVHATKPAVAGGSVGSHPASILSPFNVLQSLQDVDLHLTGDAPMEPSSSDYWEAVKKMEHTLQEYVPRLLRSAASHFRCQRFTDIVSSMRQIVGATADFRNDIKYALESRRVTLDMVTEELESAFMAIVHDIEKMKLPPPPGSKASGHAERTAKVDKILDDAMTGITDVVVRYEIEEEVVLNYVNRLRPLVFALTVTVGDINEQYPDALSTLMFCIVGLLIPESWILRPFLSLFGFGPSGPIKGSAAAWMQRYLWGAAVRPGSWFSWLQAAGMGNIPKWIGVPIKLPWVIGGAGLYAVGLFS